MQSKIKTCILKKGEDSISVTASHKKMICTFKYYGKTQPLPGWYPGDIGSWNEESEEYPNHITTDIFDGQLIWDQHIKAGFEIAF